MADIRAKCPITHKEVVVKHWDVYCASIQDGDELLFRRWGFYCPVDNTEHSGPLPERDFNLLTSVKCARYVIDVSKKDGNPPLALTDQELEIVEAHLLRVKQPEVVDEALQKIIENTDFN